MSSIPSIIKPIHIMPPYLQMCSVVLTKPAGVLSKSSTPWCQGKHKKYILQNNPSFLPENYLLLFPLFCSNVKCVCAQHHRTYTECVGSWWLDSKLGLGRVGDVSRWRWNMGGWKNEHRHVKYYHPEVSSYHQVSLWELRVWGLGVK